MKRTIDDRRYTLSPPSSSSSLSMDDDDDDDNNGNEIDDERPHTKQPKYNNCTKYQHEHDNEQPDRAARLEEEAPRFRSAPIVARPPSLAGGRLGGVGGIGLDRVPGDHLVEMQQPKDDIRQLLAAEQQKEEMDAKPSAAAAAAAGPSNWTVRGGPASLRAVPTYYPLEKSSRTVSGRSVDAIAASISDSCRVMSVHAEYEGNADVAGTAYLRTSEHVEIQLQLWRGPASHTDEGTVIVEAQRRRGDAVHFHKYSRNILDAATGIFDPSTFVRAEDREAEYCQRATDMLAAKKPTIADGATDHENALLALEIAASLLKKDRMDARQLGMESLCLLTDPTRAGVVTALVASRVVLTGSAQDESQDDADDAAAADDNGDQWGIREAVLALVQFGRLGDDGGFEQDSDSDDDSCGCGGGGVSPDEQRHNDLLHNLALAVLANALDVLETHGSRLCDEAGSESPSSVADAFLSDSHEMMERDLLKTLLAKLGDAEVKPHDATLSAKCLRSLCEASKDARRRARDLKAKQIVQTALEVGQRTHVKLEKESQKVIQTLAKAEEETNQGEH